MARTRGLYATLRITFASSGHPRLTETMPIDFVRAKRKGKR
jgi:hypothetical protein